MSVHYHHILSMAGWQKKKCSSCSGNSKARYTHPQKPNEEVIIYKLSKAFRYKKNKKYISGGSVKVLPHQHFL